MADKTATESMESPGPPTPTSRRTALRTAAGAGVVAAAGSVLAACSSDNDDEGDGAGTAGATGSAGATVDLDAPRTRRNATDLDASERAAFVDAVLALKETQSPIDPSLSYYDQFVHFHQLAVIQSRFIGHGVAHNSPSFLPWHRKLCKLFEDGLQQVSGGEVTLPYWDWTDEAAVDVIFSDDFMGPRTGDPNENYAVTSGPFARGKWNLNLIAVPVGNNDTLQNCPFPFLTRCNTFVDLESELQSQGLSTFGLPTVEQVDAALAATAYDSPPYGFNSDIATSFRCNLEGNKVGELPFLHNAIHTWVGGSWSSVFYDGVYEPQDTVFVGTLTALDTSPNDPAFFLHHCNVDRIWAVKEDRDGPSYEPESGEYEGWNLDDEMYPYTLYADSELVTRQGITNASMLDYRSLGYDYEQP